MGPGQPGSVRHFLTNRVHQRADTGNAVALAATAQDAQLLLQRGPVHANLLRRCADSARRHATVRCNGADGVQRAGFGGDCQRGGQ